LSAARSVAEIAAHFASYFAEVASIIEDSGSRWFISSSGDGEFAAAPVGGCATIIVRNRQDRGFGLVLSENGASLRGMRNLKFRIDDLRDDVQCADFLRELRRRLACAGLTRTVTIDTAENNSLAHWKHAKKARNNRTAAWNQNCY
jgi:hypothetical protein